MDEEYVTEDDVRQALIELFAEPDTSGMFTVQMIVEELGITRGQARGRLQDKLDSGEVELALEWKGTNYYRRVGKMLDNEGQMANQFEQYEHHGETAWVRSDLKGTHRDNCLCYSCERFLPGEPDNCEIAQELYELDVKHGLVTPVYECPIFEEA